MGPSAVPTRPPGHGNESALCKQERAVFKSRQSSTSFLSDGLQHRESLSQSSIHFVLSSVSYNQEAEDMAKTEKIPACPEDL